MKTVTISFTAVSTVTNITDRKVTETPIERNVCVELYKEYAPKKPNIECRYKGFLYTQFNEMNMHKVPGDRKWNTGEEKKVYVLKGEGCLDMRFPLHNGETIELFDINQRQTTKIIPVCGQENLRAIIYSPEAHGYSHFALIRKEDVIISRTC